VHGGAIAWAAMTGKPLQGPRLRLFVALDLPDGVRKGIAAWGQHELADPALRPVAAESLHVTLAFLGYREEREVEPISAAVGESAAAAPSIELLDPVARPPRGRPRLFALPARSAGAEELQGGLERRLVAAGLFTPEKRPFWPHVTLARVRSEGRGSRRTAAVSRPPGPLPPALSRPFRGVRMTLYRSELQPRGARYVPLAQVELSRGQQ
jgi:RNA 2',3'-cyclic 3'-phosphodiesterase